MGKFKWNISWIRYPEFIPANIIITFYIICIGCIHTDNRCCICCRVIPGYTGSCRIRCKFRLFQFNLLWRFQLHLIRFRIWKIIGNVYLFHFTLRIFQIWLFSHNFQIFLFAVVFRFCSSRFCFFLFRICKNFRTVEIFCRNIQLLRAGNNRLNSKRKCQHYRSKLF